MSARILRFPPIHPAAQRPGPACYPRRRPRNGHHPDCPYPDTAAEHCGICRSMTIAADADRTTSRIHPAEDTA